MTEIALVGAGPIGVELAVALRLNNFSYQHYEAGVLGSTIGWYAPQTVFFSSAERIAIADIPIHNVSQNKVSREEYLAYLRTVVGHYELDINYNSCLFSASRIDDGRFKLEISRPSSEAPYSASSAVDSEGRCEVVYASKLILAIGDMHRANDLGLPGEDKPYVSHYLQEPHNYAGQEVVIIGGRNSAIEAAIRLSRVGARVSLCHRKPELDKKSVKWWLYPEFISRVREKLISYYPNTTPVEIGSSAVVVRSKTGESKEIQAERVLILTGYVQDTTLFEQLGIELKGENRVPEFDESTMETNIPNLFLAGTAAAGTQISGTTSFIETSHVHVSRIVARLKGQQLEGRGESLRPVVLREE